MRHILLVLGWCKSNCRFQWPQDWKRSIFIPIPKKGSTKECANYQTIALISHASKVMLKILHARFQHYANQEYPDVQARFRKGRGTRDQITNICWIIEKARKFQEKKKSISVSFNMLKPSTVWIMTNCRKFLERWDIRPFCLSPEKPVCKSGSNR